MRHRKSGIKLNRTSSHRQAMFRNMVTSLFKFDRIRTTDTKAKELRKLADHLVTLAKRGDLHARRQALSIIMEKKVVHKLFEEATNRFGSISGGYTRIVKIGRRPGDAAPVSMIELLGGSEEAKKKPGKKKTKSESTAPVVKKEAVEEETDTSASKAEASAEPDAQEASAESSSEKVQKASAESKEEETPSEKSGDAPAEDKKE